VIKIIVFDFDGTLVDSNQLKYIAFFKLFQQEPRYADIIREVLSQHKEASRYVILGKILQRIEPKKPPVEKDIELLAEKYNTLVLIGAKICRERPGATEVLADLSKRYRLFLFSITPEHALKKIISHRKWMPHFSGIFGYPKEKVSVLLDVISREHVQPQEVLVVGDGQSDYDASLGAGCYFFSASKENALKKLASFLKEHKADTGGVIVDG
jgi:phosphoglycolate phosphatase-like HAD superfamily hydrolase